MNPQLYARDLSPEKQNNSFMGEGFEEMLKQAKEEGKELIIGSFCKNKDWVIE